MTTGKNILIGCIAFMFIFFIIEGMLVDVYKVAVTAMHVIPQDQEY